MACLNILAPSYSEEIFKQHASHEYLFYKNKNASKNKNKNKDKNNDKNKNTNKNKNKNKTKNKTLFSGTTSLVPFSCF